VAGLFALLEPLSAFRPPPLRRTQGEDPVAPLVDDPPFKHLVEFLTQGFDRVGIRLLVSPVD
jgi:hypothetical protein